jgi:hypothetical protein
MKLPRLPAHNPEELLDLLTTRQFVHPHQAVGQALTDIAAQAGFCDLIVDRAISWLELDHGLAIGRLRRTELAQLSRCLHRFWRQTTERRTPVPAAATAVATTS